jgi:hypothetical protein
MLAIMKNILDLFGLALFDGSNRTPPEHNCKGICSAPFGFPFERRQCIAVETSAAVTFG